MTTIRATYSDPLPNDRFGLVTGVAVAASFPSQTARLARFSTYATNNGPFYIGNSASSVSYELKPGIITDWFSVNGENLSNYQFKNPSGTNNYLSFWVQF